MRLDRLIEEQQQIASRVRITKYRQMTRTIAGADVARRGECLYSCVGVLSYPDLEVLGTAYAKARATMPYVPGFLSYRELPVLIKAFHKLKLVPDIVLVDGQGIAHPRGLGLASHLGVVLQVPTIGCAKSHLFGTYKEPRAVRGSYSTVRSKHQQVGIVLRTRTSVKPLYVSPGHLVDFRDCMRIVLSVTKGFRLPEPLRYAHRMAGLKAKGLI